ncbi:MAG: c-type cytochrome [Candidatus Eiseniibacteriota bacterium]|nr:MAG: c-type cytochrome [Candidatus Eisenbacteria bacterium]
MKRVAVLFLAFLFLTCAVLAYAGQEEKKMADPAAELAKSVKNGKVLFGDESLGTNGMTCNSCHAEGGTKDGKMGEMVIPAFDNLAAKYPKYFKMAEKVMTLSQVNNACIVMAMKGKPLSWDDQKLADLTAYVASVKKAKPEKKAEEAK